MNDYGAKASADLIVTRGKGFTKEKNKKKRGSYRGGEITVSSLGCAISLTNALTPSLVSCPDGVPLDQVQLGGWRRLDSPIDASFHDVTSS